jgi:hypothetical protein
MNQSRINASAELERDETNMVILPLASPLI